MGTPWTEGQDGNAGQTVPPEVQRPLIQRQRVAELCKGVDSGRSLDVQSTEGGTVEDPRS